MTRVVRRTEDMTQLGHLEILIQDDGDIIVAVRPELDGLIEEGGSVEFCIPGIGGGRSPHTHAALLALVAAIELDNAELSSHPDPADSPVIGDAACPLCGGSGMVSVFQRCICTY